MKVKVGVGDDAGRVAAARAAAGPQVALRLDANGAWSVEEAVRAIDVLAPAGLELVEEPVHGLQAVREVRERVAVRVAIDETAAEHGALGAGVADAVCLKISRCGGISSLLAAATLVRASGAEVYLASTLDGPLGIAAAIHAAAALASRGPVPHCGLATLGLFEDLENPLPVRGGQIDLPAGRGAGGRPALVHALQRHRHRRRILQRQAVTARHDEQAGVCEPLRPCARRARGTSHRGCRPRRARASSARPAAPTAAPSPRCRCRAEHRRARPGGCGAGPRVRAPPPQADPRRTAAGSASAR